MTGHHRIMSIPFVPAKHYRTSSRTANDIKWIVVHDMEMAEKGSTAEACAKMFATTTREASAHYCIDNNSVVQCVRDKDIAWAAGGGNTYGLHFEHAGFANQSRKDWVDAFSQDMLVVSAKLAAAKAVKYKIPVVKLTTDQVRAGKRGFCGHREITYAFGISTHTDPGANFPWDIYITMVKAEVAKLKGSPWTKGKLAAAAAAVGMAASVFAGISIAPTPVPKPSPTVTKTVTVAPTPSPTVTKKPTPSPTTSKKPTPAKARLRAAYPGYRIMPGQTNSPNVKRVQARLKALGYYKGSVDGDFGPRTKAAVTAYQKAKRLSPVGYVGPKTWRALFTY